MFVMPMEFLLLLWRSLCVGLTQGVNLSQTMPRCISPDVNSLTLSISVSLWAGTTLTDIMKRLALDAAIERKNCQKTCLQLCFETEIPEEDVEESDVKTSETSSSVLSWIRLLLETTDELEITEINELSKLSRSECRNRESRNQRTMRAVKIRNKI